MVRKDLTPPETVDALQLKIRAGIGRDEPFVKALSSEVFDQFGDYGTFLPTYLNHPSVFTSIVELSNAPVGFLMLAVVASQRPLPGDDDLVVDEEDGTEQDPQEWLDAEILAIAVVPQCQGRSIGRHLLRHALNYVASWQRAISLRSVQLNVADSNCKAIRFFKKMGFVVVNPEDGKYPMGQRSIRMALRLAPTDR